MVSQLLFPVSIFTPLFPQIRVMMRISAEAMSIGSHSLSTISRKSTEAMTTVTTLPTRNMATCIFSLDCPKLSTAPYTVTMLMTHSAITQKNSTGSTHRTAPAM